MQPMLARMPSAWPQLLDRPDKGTFCRSILTSNVALRVRVQQFVDLRLLEEHVWRYKELIALPWLKDVPAICSPVTKSRGMKMLEWSRNAIGMLAT